MTKFCDSPQEFALDRSSDPGYISDFLVVRFPM